MELPGLDDLQQEYGRSIGQLHDPRKFTQGLSDEGPDYTGMALGLIGGQNRRRRGGGGGGASGPLMNRLRGLGGSDIEVLYGKNVPDHADHLHLAAQQGLGKVLKKLDKKGFRIGEHPKYGGVGGGHTDNSWHYSGKAADINYDPGSGRWDSEQQALKWLKRQLKKALGDSAYYG